MSDRGRSAVKLTYEDYCRIPDDGLRHEILAGEHHVTPAPGTIHQRILVKLCATLHTQLDSVGLGQVFVAPTDLQLSEVDVCQPDLMVILAGKSHIITPTKVKGVPDLVVEILSDSTEKQDRERKKERYRMAGIPEYWIVDPREHVVEQHLLQGGQYRLAERCEGLLRPAACQEVQIEVSRLW